MSLPSVVLSRTAAVSLRATRSAANYASWDPILSVNKISGIMHCQSRSVWLEVIRQIPSDDPNRRGELAFENPDLADMRMRRADNADGKCRPYVFVLIHFVTCEVL